MKKNKFWLIIGALSLILAVLYVVFVSNARDGLKQEELSKDRAIKDLVTLKSKATSGDLASTEARKSIDKGVKQVGQRITDIENYLKDIQKDFLYVKGDKEWKYTPETTIQYNSWYNAKRNALVDILKESGFVFENEAKTEMTPADMDRMKEKIGFKNWGTGQPTEAELLEVQQQLALLTVVIESVSTVFKNQKNIFPIFQKVSIDTSMELDNFNNVKRSHGTFKIDCPYAYINLVINELEKNKLHIKVDSIEVAKKINSKEYSEFPNVAVVLALSFQIINDKKGPQ